MMKFEHLIWIIVFLVFVGFTIIKRLRTASNSKNEDNKSIKPRGNWKERLDKFISQVQQIAGDEGRIKHQAQRRRDIFAEGIESAVEKPPLPDQKPVLPKSVTQPDEATYAEKDTLPSYFDSGKSELRKAVIWSEILAPPLSLREEGPN
jgi:hypothetical protein